MARYTITVDGVYAYSVDASSLRLATNKALVLHEKFTKERHAAGHLAPQRLNEAARKRGVRLYIATDRSEPDGEPPKPKRRRVKRGFIR
jgi:hypothetical protein